MSRPFTQPTVVADRLDAGLRALAGLVEPGRPGWTRTALGEVDRDARELVRRWMADAGMETRVDGAGNVVGRLRGTGSGRTIMLGSHTDTVVGGGRFDGTVGVVGALEVVRALRESGRRLEHDLVVVDFFDEEPNEFGLSCVGSRAMVGELTREHLEMHDEEGRTLADALARVGVDPGAALTARADLSDVDVFVELHIEQGPYLEQQGASIGLVESITGISRFRALFSGRADHAGTTPMDVRRDAGCAAAGTVLAVERIAGEGALTKGTSGAVTFTPAAVNVVTATAEFRGEFRGPEAEWLRHAQDRLTAAAQEEGERRQVGVDVEWLPLQEPAPMAPGVLGTLTGVVDALGLSASRLFSGAEHDAAVLARSVPTGMLFVPSRDGRSHCPEEWTDLDDIAAGVTALLHSVLALDEGGVR
ncbi:Zn-dependent hydrolase [Ornithinimicrobium humiphilum]|uniref:N-carbamoyl-L-amino-acid hydrolase n=1 Tax=Ornithinimicrobium humiphilum TaxID=125288 RepID=A0A543KL57_9MICO|nr:M20 family metallo-hydrolase [Ornithinimicrobium humiphilum]TQM95822.1 N-carbamoyl-L-amino-acid hydrolase [Ornithinimicrobium humiphilum]